MHKLTKTDLEILRVLQRDCRVSREAIGEEIKKSASAVSRRVAELIEDKIITGMHAAIDPKKVGLTMTVFMLVTLEKQGGGGTGDFERAIEVMPNVVEWARISSSWDYLVKVMVRDSDHYEIVHAEILGAPRVARIRGKPIIGKLHTKPLPLGEFG